MQYASAQFRDFEFQDAEMSLFSLEAGCLAVTVKHLNIRRGAPENPHSSDMEIALARITFRDFRVVSYEPGRVWKQDMLGRFHPAGPQVIHQGMAAEQHLLHELRAGLTLYEFSSEGEGIYRIGGCGSEPWFTAQIAISGLLIEWDAYTDPAWYVQGQRRKTN